jgi:hypothetical protein
MNTSLLASTLLTLALLGGCSDLAVRAAPAKQPQPSTSALARHATVSFWDAFSNARYDDIPSVQRLLTAAYLENPADPKVALLLAHTHLWKVAERARLTPVPPEITDHLAVAERYFTEARVLAPDDARIPGWLGAVKLALGNVHHEEGLTREGYYLLKRSTEDVPHFHLFTFSFVLMNRPYDSPRFAEGVDAIWRNLELCSGRRFDRPHLVIDQAAYRAGRDFGDGRHVCYNGRIPHNVEGFFLHFGDVMVKSGQREAALTAWRAVKDVPEYATWRFKPALEERLADVDGWMTRLRDADPKNDPPVLSASTMACTGCHAR